MTHYTWNSDEAETGIKRIIIQSQHTRKLKFPTHCKRNKVPFGILETEELEQQNDKLGVKLAFKTLVCSLNSSSSSESASGS